MSITTPLPPAMAATTRAAVVPDEVALSGLTELLVLRDHDPHWWDTLALRTDALALAIAAHDSDPAGRCAEPPSGAGGGSAASAHGRRLRVEHAEIAREIADLRALLVSARGDARGPGLVLAEATAIIALVRGHNRRARDTLVPTA